MLEETDPIHKSRMYDVRFPSSVIRQAQELVCSYLDEKLRKEAKFYWSVTTVDGEHITVKSAEDFYFRHDDTVATRSSSLLMVKGYVSTRLGVLSQDFRTDVEVSLPSRTHVDNVLELFAREERKILASAPAPVENVVREGQQDVTPTPPIPTKLKVFIGHGHDPQWKELRDFLSRLPALEVVSYESSSTAGHPTAAVIKAKIESAEMAFIMHTGEDEGKDGSTHARENVVHEAGMCQNQLGSERAIILLENGCNEYSNIHGIDQIRFPKSQVRMVFGDVMQSILREFPGRL